MSGRMTKPNKRPGYPVCICKGNGQIELYDPSAWRRAEWKRIQRIEKEEKAHASQSRNEKICD